MTNKTEKTKLRSPFFLVNPKAYLYGQSSLDLAKEADKFSEQYDIDIIFTVQHADIYKISKETKNIIITAQHMDPITPGVGMGHILPEGLVEAGAKGTFLNHAEHPIPISQLVKTVQRAKDLGIIVVLLADSIAEAKALATLEPDAMICEPTELIGKGKSSDISYMKKTNETIKSISPNTMTIQAAGISTPADIRKALESGADGSGGTSGIVCAKDPKATMRAMIEEIVKIRSENKLL